ncbi:Permease of the drug/metabolite transporter (DMT) superfamily [Sinosporangium album]|uniref:Permease of the drug/metabolite transporter (DMT) superfamily n=1 Tax=Sinosporangium album TaxID=504805 RepID=A0A1G7XYX6_9ACTN|nr:DMT family transporter [Sinosporangium album]SDG89379.1 Permease of the drug/metabolite transporter (DMT) superfamily [Sinosporangium album]
MNATVHGISPWRGRAAAGSAAAAMFLMGTLAPVSDLIKDYPVYGGMAVRYTMGAAVLVAVCAAMRLRFVRLTPREIVLLAALTLVGLVLFNVGVVEATRHGGATLAGTVLGAVPLVLALVGGGRPTPRLLAGAGVVVVGTTVATGLGTGGPTALMWALFALGCETGFSLLAIPLLPKLGAVRTSAYVSALAVPMLLAMGWVADGPAMLRAPDRGELLGLAYLGVIVTAAAFLLWYFALPRLGPGRAGLFAGVVPISAILTVTVLGGGPPSVGEAVGALMVVGGILIGLSAPQTATGTTRSKSPSKSSTRSKGIEVGLSQGMANAAGAQSAPAVEVSRVNAPATGGRGL